MWTIVQFVGNVSTLDWVRAARSNGNRWYLERINSQYSASSVSSDCSSLSLSELIGENFPSFMLRLEVTSPAPSAARIGQRRSSLFLVGILYEMTSSISRLKVTLAHTSRFRVGQVKWA